MFGKVTSQGKRYAAQRLILLVVFAGVLFGAAGRLDWPRAWGYLLVVALLEAVSLALLASLAPETLNRRGTLGAGVKSYDKVFALCWLVLSFGTAVVAGLDVGRFGWSLLPEGLFRVGVVMVCLGSGFGLWAMVVNEHFEQFARIQQDRAHRVVATGPYRIVRHPGYLGFIVGALATPGMLGSAWSFVPVGLLVLLFVVRTTLEDNFLRRELAGYEEYSRRTRYRLIPLVW